MRGGGLQVSWRDWIAAGLPRPDLARAAAHCWIAIAAAYYVYELIRTTSHGLTDGSERPLGWDFINTWAGAFLAWRGDPGAIYDWNAFHTFQERITGAPIDFFHYSYPPTLLVLTAPLALVPYVPALALWTAASWAAFFASLRAVMPRGVLLLALATPAVLINAIGGQNGAWSAALFGAGLYFLASRPVVAGILFGLFVYKPHLALLIPVALLAGRQWLALGAAGATAAALVLASAGFFGVEIWHDYFRNVAVLREVFLEHGGGVWHRMLSVFVFFRRLGFDIQTAYLLQTAVAAMVAAVVAYLWYRETPANARYAVLVLGSFLVTPYLHDYDLVAGAFVAVWLIGTARASMQGEAFVASALILIVPVAGMILAKLTGYSFGPVFIVPAFLIAARIALDTGNQVTAIARNRQ